LSLQGWKKEDAGIESNHAALKDKAMVHVLPHGTYPYWSNEYGCLHLIILWSIIMGNHFIHN
jgi:hypothetical protein